MTERRIERNNFAPVTSQSTKQEEQKESSLMLEDGPSTLIETSLSPSPKPKLAFILSCPAPVMLSFNYLNFLAIRRVFEAWQLECLSTSNHRKGLSNRSRVFRSSVPHVSRAKLPKGYLSDEKEFQKFWSLILLTVGTKLYEISR